MYNLFHGSYRIWIIMIIIYFHNTKYFKRLFDFDVFFKYTMRIMNIIHQKCIYIQINHDSNTF